MRKLRKLFIAAAVVIIFLLLPMSQIAHTADNPFVTDLIAGQNMDAGSVKVWNADGYLYVQYVGEDGWLITETHLEIVTDIADFPTSGSGNPKIGKFTWSSSHDPGVESYTYEILDEWGPDVDLHIAAHAVVWKEGMGSETAWGCWEGDNGGTWEGKRWGCWFDYTTQDEPGEPDKVIELPSILTLVNIYPTETVPGADSYFDVQIFFEGTYPNIVSGETYNGWCADSLIALGEARTGLTNIPIYSSLDPDSLPDYAKDEEWEYINYILNHKAEGATATDIQQAIWYFADDGYPMPTDTEAAAMVADAQANGAGFYPGVGEWFAVILDLNDGENQVRQLIFIEVDP